VARAPETYPNDSAVWSPDGTVIAAAKNIVLPTSHERIVIVDAGTGKETNLGEKTFPDIDRVAWLPDGSGVLCVATELESLQNKQIFLIDYPTGNARKITNDLSDYFGIGVTADGKSLVAAQTSAISNLWVLPQGEPPRQITSGSGMKVFDLHARGKHIYFTGVQEASSNIWVAGVDGSNARPLLPDQETNWGPAVPDDESFVAFVSMREGNVPRLWRVEPDGTNPRKVSDEALVGQPPSVSPDGKFILFRSAKATDLKRVPSGGGGTTLVTDQLRAGGGYSRDGTKIVMAMYVPDRGGRIDARVAVLPAEGGTPIQTLVARSRDYGYGPDNESLAYMLHEDGVSNLWRHPFDGSEPTKLTSFTSGRIFSWDWGADGTLYLGRGELSSDVVLITDFR
jgi:Tol biopolymer transport system component